MVKAFSIRVSGRVTGVGFRYSTRNFVNRFADIRGYVRNVGEGVVEVLVQGDEYHLHEIVEWLKKGPSHARVDDIKINEIPVSPCIGMFEITH